MAANNDYARTLTLLDTNLFSGSAELFRTAIGASWAIGSSSTEGEFLQFGEGQAPPTYNSWTFPTNTYLTSFDSNSDMVSDLESDETTLTPIFRVPIRLVGDPAKITSDKQWKAIVKGTAYAGISYPGLYNAGTYDATPFQIYVPYTKQDSKLLRGSDDSNPEPTQQIEISYNYQYYLEEYENYIATLDSETLIPNLYFFEIFKGQKDNLNPTNGSDPSFKVNSTIAEFANLDILTDDELSELYDPEITSVLPHFNITSDDLTSTLDSNNTAIPNSTEYYDKTLRMRNYLTGTYAYGAVPPGPATDIPIILKNIFFDEKAFESGGLLEDMEEDITKFPYYIKINFPMDSTTQLSWTTTNVDGSLKEQLITNNCSQKFMKTLKEVFLGEINDVPIETIDIIEGAEYNEATWNATAEGEVHGVSTADTTTMKAVDLSLLMMSCYNNYNSEMQNCYFMGEETEARELVLSNDSTQRYQNTISSLGVLNALQYWSRLKFFQLAWAGYEVSTILAMAGDLENPGGSSNDDRNIGTETVAYRVEKLGGPPQGDGFSPTTIQNYWFFNGEAEVLKFYDSQVKYGTDYTYKVYAYVVVIGSKYEYSDLRLSRQIGTANPITAALQKEIEAGTMTQSEAEAAAALQHCLEFYDPATDKVASQLYDTEATLETYYNLLPAATNAQYIGDEAYLADFYFTYSPTIKIVEVPLYSKSLQILDNPGSNLDVIPYQVLDDSQTIGFVLNYEFFVQNSFPYSMTAQEAELKTNYQNANDFVPGEEVTKDSVSKARYVEVYRMDTKPTAVSDFSDHVYERIDLRLPNTKDVNNIANFVDKIRTNHTYYYLFRVLNEHNIPSHISEIYETTLVNDGGYKYATFNTLFEEDLKEDAFTEPSKFFKKLMHLKPNTSHLAFDSSDVDFAETASSQIGDLIVGNADDTLWGKTFKIRMTSKKTGKKIDLNITYNLENDV